MTRLVLTALVVLAVSSVASTAMAIGEFESDDGQIAGDLTGFFRMSMNTAHNPKPELLYPHDNDSTSLLLGRLLGTLNVGDHLKLSFNGLRSLTSTTAPTTFGGPRLERGRSDALSWRLNRDPQANTELAVDQLNATLSADWLDVKIGRQPISLATSYLFTPNDLFAPFSAQTFFRTYKPGVDAVRVEATLGDFTQIAAYGVMGYEPRDDGLDPMSLRQSAGVMRGSTVVGDFEFGLLGGRLHDRTVAGGDLQGEVFEWLGVRGEGHVAMPNEGDTHAEVSLGLEHRFDNTLFLRLEGFWHGAGFTDPQQYASALIGASNETAYLGREYVAAAAGYELTPLVNLDSVLIANLSDGSVFSSVYVVISVSDEAELALTAAVPLGAETTFDAMLQPSIGSEFGLYPASVGADFRLYW